MVTPTTTAKTKVLIEEVLYFYGEVSASGGPARRIYGLAIESRDDRVLLAVDADAWPAPEFEDAVVQLEWAGRQRRVYLLTGPQDVMTTARPANWPSGARFASDFDVADNALEKHA